MNAAAERPLPRFVRERPHLVRWWRDTCAILREAAAGTFDGRGGRTKEPQHACRYCGETLRSRKALIVHEQAHKGGKVPVHDTS